MAHGDKGADEEVEKLASKKGGKRKITSNKSNKEGTSFQGKPRNKTFRAGLGTLVTVLSKNLNIKPAKQDAADLEKLKKDVKDAEEALANVIDGVDVEESKVLQETTEALETFMNKMGQQYKLKEAGFWDFFNALKEGKVSSKDCRKSPRAMEHVIKNFVAGHFFKIFGKLFGLDANSVAVHYGLKRKKVSAEDLVKYAPKIDESLKELALYINYFKKNEEADDQEGPDTSNTYHLDGNEDEEDQSDGSEDDVNQNDENRDDSKIAAEVEEGQGNKKENLDNNKHGQKLSKRAIIKALQDVYGKKDKELEFVQLFLLLAICTLFIPLNAAQYLPYQYLNCVKSMEAIQTLSWPDLIFDHLMNNIMMYHTVPYSVNGCVDILMYNVFEQIEELKDHRTTGAFPRYAQWKFYKASCQVANMIGNGSPAKTVSFEKSLNEWEKDLCLPEALVISKLEHEVMEKNGIISHLEKQLNEKDKVIDALREKNPDIYAEVNRTLDQEGPSHKAEDQGMKSNSFLIQEDSDEKNLSRKRKMSTPENTLDLNSKKTRTEMATNASGSGRNSSKIDINLRKLAIVKEYLGKGKIKADLETKEKNLNLLEEYLKCGSLRDSLWRWNDEEGHKIFIDGEDIFKLLTVKSFIPNQVVDFQMLKWREQHADGKMMFFLTNAWYQVSRKSEEMQKKVIDDFLAAAKIDDLEHLFIPMNNSSDPDKPDIGCHFTLLHRDVVKGVWYHYDSLSESKSEFQAQCLNNAVLMAGRVHEALYRDGNGTQFRGITTIVCPQQGKTYDCATFILYFTERLINNQQFDYYGSCAKDKARKKRLTLAFDIVKDGERWWKHSDGVI